MRYLTSDDVIRINESEVGPKQLADFGLLESAVLRPQSSAGGEDAYPDVHSKAAALMHSLIQNHPFLDGNKRTASLAAVIFHGLNGWWINADDGDLINLALDVANGRMDWPEIADVLKSWAEELQLPET